MTSSDIERYLNPEEPNRQTPQRFGPPPWLTTAGQEDRRNEAAHVVAMRQIQREIERHLAETYRSSIRDAAAIEADSRLLSDTKWRLHRARKESEVLAATDPELQAKCGVLDDDFFQRRRRHLLFGLDD